MVQDLTLIMNTDDLTASWINTKLQQMPKRSGSAKQAVCSVVTELVVIMYNYETSSDRCYLMTAVQVQEGRLISKLKN